METGDQSGLSDALIGFGLIKQAVKRPAVNI